MPQAASVRFKLAVLAAAMAGLQAGPTAAATVSWAGGSSFWDIAANWGPLAALPGAGDDVVINPAGLQTITYRSGSSVIGSLAMPGDDVLALTGGSLAVTSGFASSGTTRITSGTLTLNGASTMKDLQLSGQFSTLNGGGALQVAAGGVFTWFGSSTHAGTGTTTIASGATMNVTGAATLSQRTLVNEGSAVITGVLENSGSLRNAAGATFELRDNGTFSQFSGGTFNNAGTVGKTGTGTSVLHGLFNNAGIVEAQSGTLQLVAGGLMNGGTYTTSGGTLQLAGGTHIVDTQATITGSGVQLTGQFSTLTGPGTLQIAPGAVFTWTGSSTQSGTGTTNVAGGATMNIGNAFLSQRTLVNDGSIVVTGVLDNSGTIRNNAGRTFELRGSGTFSQFSSGVFNNAGTVIKTGAGTSQLRGTFNNAGVVDAQAGTLQIINGGLMNGGTYTTSGGTLQLAEGNHTVGTQATISSSGVQLTGQFSTLTGPGTLQIAPGAVFTWTGSSTQAGTGITNVADGAVMNIGNAFLSQRTLVNDGSTAVTGVLDNSGTIRNNAGRTFELRGSGTFSQFSSGVFNNAGTVIKTGAGTSQLRGTFNNAGVVDAQAGTLQIVEGGLMNGGTYTTSGGTLQFSGGTHTVSTSADITGTGVQLIGQFTTLTGNGTLQVAPGAVFTWTSSSSQAGTGSTVIAAGAAMNVGNAVLNQRTLVNNGNSVLTGVLTNNGTLRNAAGGSLEIRDGGSFDQFSGGSFDNAGTVTRIGTGTSTVYGAFANTGRVQVQGGTLAANRAFTNAGTLDVAAGAVFRAATAPFVNAGSVSGNGTIATPTVGLLNQGRIDPGNSIGALTVSGALQMASSGVISFELASLSSFDLLTVTGSATLGGTLSVANAGYTPVIGDTFRVMNYASFTGSVLDVVEVGFGSGVQFEALVFANHLDLRVTAVPEPGSWALLAAGLLGVGWARRARGRGDAV